jgi:hypothetical protein
MVDTLADADGKFFGRNAPAQGWPKPISANFYRPGFRDLMEGKVKAHPSGPTDMDFVIPAPWAAARAGVGYVKPDRRILEEFLRLELAEDSQIYKFAAKYGPLLIFGRFETTEERKLIVHEYSEVWRYMARCMNSLLRIAAKLYAGRSSADSDWDAIGKCPFPVYAAAERSEHTDWLDPSPFSAEEDWSGMTNFIGRGHSRNREMWATLLNTLLRFGRARPWVIWGSAASAARPQMVFSGPSLLSYLALQLCLMALKQDAFVVCTFCQREYPPTRAPKSGQRNFCPDCREQGSPVLVAQRSRRDRLRNNGLDISR